MKRQLSLLCLLLVLSGCARFSTKQVDVSYEYGAQYPTRKITTKASAIAFFESSSKLAQFKAANTDKSQTASISGLDQAANGTNVVAALNAIATIVEKVK